MVPLAAGRAGLAADGGREQQRHAGGTARPGAGWPVARVERLRARRRRSTVAPKPLDQRACARDRAVSQSSVPRRCPSARTLPAMASVSHGRRRVLVEDRVDLDDLGAEVGQALRPPPRTPPATSRVDRARSRASGDQPTRRGACSSLERAGPAGVGHRAATAGRWARGRRPRRAPG